MMRWTLLAPAVVGAVLLTGCSKSTPETEAPAMGAGIPPAAAPAAGNLTNTLTSQLGLPADKANAAVGSVLSYAQGRLSPEDYGKVAGAIPGASNYVQQAVDAGAVTGPISDPAGLDSAFSKLGISPDVAKQIGPLISQEVGKTAGPDVGNLLGGLF
jgi:hypothetical protein